MPGTISTPSGDIVAGANTEGEDVYNCSLCKEVIPLHPSQKIQTICRLIQTHLEQCNLSNLLSTPHRLPPLAELRMPLQPRRTWSAEDERRRRLEEDPDAYDVGPHTVTCAGCHRPIRLNATGRYYAANWNKHKMGCKNTNAVNGASAMSAESKFTGRVAAFRVAKPAESSEAFAPSSTSDVPTARESNHLQTQTPGPSYAPLAESYTQSSIREHTRPWADELASRGLPAAEHYAATSVSHDSQRTVVGTDSAYNRPLSESHNRMPYTCAQIDVSKALDSDEPESSPRLRIHRPSRSPNGPSLRHDEREIYGPSHPPSGAEYDRYGENPYDMPTRGLRPTQEGSVRPLRHSENAIRQGAYPPPAKEALSELQHTLDKGKARHVESRDSSSLHILRHPPLREHTYSNPESRRRIVSDRLTRIHDRVNILVSHSSQRKSPRPGNQANRVRTLGESGVASDLGSSSVASSPEFSAAGPSRSASATESNALDSQPQTYNHFDGRALPPLSSLTLTSGANAFTSSGAISEMDQRRRAWSKERHSGSSFSVDLDRSPVWRERTRVWVQTGTAWPASDRDTPESVVLPPIRTASNPSLTGPSGTRRRQREGDEPDANSIEEDRPSPPKVFVLPMHPSHSSSTLRTDDLFLKYKHAGASSDEAMDVGGDSMRTTLVGNQSELSTSPLKDAQVNAARLHPVWKWERKEDVSGAPSLPQFSETERNGNVIMNTANIKERI